MAPNLVKLLETRSLPLSMRGYDRAATDEFLGALHASLQSMLGEHAGAEARVAALEAKVADGERVQARLAELEAEVESGIRAEARAAELEEQLANVRMREREITDALVVAARVRAETEREAKELKAEHTRQIATIEADARRRAEMLVQDAQERADKILKEAKTRAQDLEREVQIATELAGEARGRVTSFLESILAEVRRRPAARSNVIDDLAPGGSDRGGSAMSDRERTAQDPRVASGSD